MCLLVRSINLIDVMIPIVFYCIVGYVGRYCLLVIVFFFQAEDGIRDLVRSRGLGDVYKRQVVNTKQRHTKDRR